MNFAFDVELHQPQRGDECVTLYTFIKQDATQTEYERFLHDPEIQEAADYVRLQVRLEGLVNDYGLFPPEGWFRDEGDGTIALWAPTPRAERPRYSGQYYPQLRLYGFGLYGVESTDDCGETYSHSPILVLGYGGIKTVQNPNEDPQLREALGDVKYVKRRLYESLRSGETRIIEGGFLLEGKLSFDREFK